MWYLHTMEYYNNKEESTINAFTIYTDLKNMLSKRSQAQETTYCVIPLIGNFKKRQKTIETANHQWLLGTG